MGLWARLKAFDESAADVSKDPKRWSWWLVLLPFAVLATVVAVFDPRFHILAYLLWMTGASGAFFAGYNKRRCEEIQGTPPRDHRR